MPPAIFTTAAIDAVRRWALAAAGGGAVLLGLVAWAPAGPLGLALILGALTVGAGRRPEVQQADDEVTLTTATDARRDYEEAVRAWVGER